jgi:uncharacterized protein (TIGR02246 family)
MSSDVAQINATVDRYVAAVNAGDVKAYGSALTQDVVFMPPDASKLTGREAVQAWAKKEFFDPYELRFHTKFDDLRVVGSQAFAPGSFTLDLTPKAGGEQIRRTGKFMNVFRKEADGSWKYALAIFNFDQPLAMTA